MERHIGGAIHQLHNLLGRENNRFPHGELVDRMTGSHGFILCWLYEHRNDGDIFQKDLEKQLRLRRSSVTGVLQVMERNGLIERTPVSSDARLKKLTLTPRAEELYRILCSDMAETERRMSAGIPAQDLAAFWRTVDRIRDNLERGLFTEQESGALHQQEGMQ